MTRVKEGSPFLAGHEDRHRVKEIDNVNGVAGCFDASPGRNHANVPRRRHPKVLNHQVDEEPIRHQVGDHVRA